MRRATSRPSRARPGAGRRAISELLEPRRLLSTDVLRWHNDLAQTGLNSTETQLTPTNVNPATFAKQFSYPVDGLVFAQPLYVSGLAIPGHGTHDVVIVATENDSVYAFDADSSSAAAGGGMLWHSSLGTPASVPNPYIGGRYGPYGDVSPTVGITGTPFIDRTTNTIYVDAFTNDAVGAYSHRIHALDLTTGLDKVTPTLVTATFPGNGVGGDGTNNIFAANRQLQRPALTLINGLLYVSYGSYGDTDPYHGWVLGFDPTSLQLKTVFDTTPNLLTPLGNNPGEGAIWQTGAGPTSDGSNLYFMIGNGDFNASIGDYGDSFIKLGTANNHLSISDYFTPSNQQQLSDADQDLGSGGAMLLPDSVGSTAHPHLLIGCGKQGLIYLIDTSNMGGFGATDNVVQEVSLGSGTWSSPAYFNGRVYFHGVNDVLKAFSISNGLLSSSPVAQGMVNYGYPGATPTITSNGTANGIAWELDSSGTLHAYDANTLQEIYNSNMAGARDQLGSYVKFTLPAVADGKVFVGTANSVVIFGLLPPPTAPPPIPAGLTAALGPGSSVLLTWTDNGAVSNYRVERSIDAINFAQIATVPGAGAGATATFTDMPVDGWGQTFYYRVRAFNTYNNGSLSDPSSVVSINISSPVTSFTDTYSTNTSSHYVRSAGNPAFQDSWTVSSGTLNYAVQSSDNNWNSSVFLLKPEIASTGGMAVSTTSGDIFRGQNYQAGLILSGDTTDGGFIVQEYNAGQFVNHLVLLRETGAQLLGDEGGTGNPPVLADFGDISANEGDTFHISGTIDRTGTHPVITVSITDLTTPSFTIASQTVADTGDPTDFGGAQIGWRARYHDATAAFSVDNLSVTSGLAPAAHAPAAPSNLTAVQTSGSVSVNLAWTNNADNALEFQVERSSDGTNYALIATVPGVPLNSTAAFTDVPLASPGQTLYYRVRAFNGFHGGTSSVPSNVATLTITAPIVNFLDDYHTDTTGNYTEMTQTAPPVFQDSWTVSGGRLNYAVQSTNMWNTSVFLLNPGIASTNGLARFVTSGDFIVPQNFQPGLILSGDTINGGFVVQEYDNGTFNNHLVLLRETGGQLLGDEGGTGNPPVLADMGDISAHAGDTFHISGTIDRSGPHPLITIAVTDLTNPAFTIAQQTVTDSFDPANYGGTQIGWRARYQDATAAFSVDNLALHSLLPPNTVVGTAGNDTITIRKNSDGTHDDIWVNVPTTGPATQQALIGQTIVINGAGGTDTLTVDSTNGNPIPTGGTAVLRLNSGAGNFTIGGSLPTLDAIHVMDVGTSTVNIPYSSTSPVAQIRNDLKTGFIKSTEAGGSGGKFAIADSDSGSQITLKYAVIGDADINGTVSSADLLALAQHYGQANADWSQGDFNYDGTVNFSDLLALAQHYAQTAASTPAAIFAAASSGLDESLLKVKSRRLGTRGSQ